MTLQKLVHLEGDEGKDPDSDGASTGESGSPLRFLRNIFRRSKSNDPDTTAADPHDTTSDFMKGNTKDGVSDSPRELKTIQRYFPGHNQERTAYMEKNSALTKKNLAVSAEQVSIFLTEGKIVDSNKSENY
jgi:hypothetical protein